MIFKVLKDVTDCLKKGLEYDRERQQYDEVRETRKLKVGSLDEQLIPNWIEDGLGFRQTTMLLNSHHQQQGLPLVGQKSVYNAINWLSPKILKDRKKPQTADNPWSEAYINWIYPLLLCSKSTTIWT